ncbi:hypothetical protein D9V30_13975 [Mycetocola reblochoni]|uniref:Octaprenyl diphosphate synthase / Dimethylallyltransferase / (2E,6E)-farnesyl diphosphate synthase / Geranylgeranyl diphosphate synthase n=2 Tax=Mycetocola reblochoni TaxID=331618 RepID=A0A1R4J0E3_9MICO|nr:polyprenyl synthetase family protein [Mycetocola reblochoni]RLP67547.1 hypothetical protein D9V30_13975 [Mycetocola reblochoni]SJN25479.1 Octaprenyl diphosphate synthase / Dimethylallyltransferase / (2E,6E)-farnesyl diphosphate synthase / Geranylgeranyl diphosphate synthase [Mycetocola reblochoni REB411]
MLDTLQTPGETDTLLLEIENSIRKMLEGQRARSVAHGPHFARLWQLGANTLLGGKLLRPRLLMGAFDALASAPGSDPASRDTALRVAAAAELLHFSFLLHDDVIDEDLLRRGAPNVIGCVRAEAKTVRQSRGAASAKDRSLHWARSNGILLGDLMLSAVHQELARIAAPEHTRLALLDLLDRTITESIVGEHLDVGLSDGVIDPDLTTVLEMSRLKTATYTFELPLRAAAILAGVDARVEARAGEVARNLGVALVKSPVVV